MDFDFALVDGLTSLPPNQVDGAIRRIGSVTVQRIGAVVEYGFIRRQQGFAHLPMPTVLAQSAATTAVENAANRHSIALSTTGIFASSFELAALPSTIAQNAPWGAFIRRLVDAAKRAGFADMTAKAMGAAFVELADNAIDHSEHPGSAIISYRWQSGEFEMVIADAGIGIRNSLRKNPKHLGLTDDQFALEQVTTTMGITRYPDGSGHGTGFKTVFDALAGLGGTLRFRSGTAALVLNGSDLPSITRRSVQRDLFSGFVASILCRG